MEVTENRRKLTVGIFIFIGLLIFIIGIFTLGNQKRTFIKSFTVNAVFNNIEGLKEGGNIWFSGVKVGTIKKIRFYGSSQVQVFMNIEKDVQKYIHKDAKVSISSDGLIGNKIIVITAGSIKVPVIEQDDQLTAVSTISTDEIMKTFQVNNRNLVDITSDLKILSANMLAGKGTAGMLLSDKKLAENFEAMVLNLKNTSALTRKMASDLRVFSRTLNTKDGFANQVLTDTVIFNRLQVAANKLQELAGAATVLTDNLNNASSKLNDKDNPAGLLLNDQESAEHIRQILRNLETSTYNLDQDLKALQSNFLLRGYFKKKVKKAEGN